MILKPKSDIAFTKNIFYCIAITFAVTYCLSLYVPIHFPFEVNSISASISILKSILEEFIFRFLFLTLCCNYFGMLQSLIISSLLFSYAHFGFDWFQINYLLFISRFVSGLYYGWAYLSTRSIIVPITLHILWNMSIIPFEKVIVTETSVIDVYVKITYLILVVIYFKYPVKKLSLIHY